MSSQVRTVFAGLGVAAVCFAFAALEWRHLLALFAVAGIAWGFSGWLRQNRSTEAPSILQSRDTRRRRRTGELDLKENVLSFPTTEWGMPGVSDASGS